MSWYKHGLNTTARFFCSRCGKKLEIILKIIYDEKDQTLYLTNVDCKHGKKDD
jgi:uracil-DNA glycosylase